MTTILLIFACTTLYTVGYVACYPIYHKLGGRDSFEEYIGKL